MENSKTKSGGLIPLTMLTDDQIYVPPFEDLTIMIYGHPGSGKTRFCAGDQKALFASTEPGQQFVRATVIDIRNWDTFKNFVIELSGMIKEGKCEYSAVVIDIVDNLNIQCRDSVCQKKGMTYPSEKDFGKTWSECNREWTDWLRALMDRINVRFITHCTTTQVDGSLPNGLKTEITRYVPTFSGNRGAQYLDGVVNCVGYVTKTVDGKHVITFKQDATVAAKDRTDILAQLGEMELDWNAVSKQYVDKAKELGYTIQSMKRLKNADK